MDRYENIAVLDFSQTHQEKSKLYLKRHDFPILYQNVHGKPLIYLDNAATTQKPLRVISAIQNYYTEDNANVHRGVYDLSVRATKAFEGARQKVQHFLNAKEDKEIIFTSGTTEAINLVAQTFGRKYVHKGDEIIVSEMEHHSNIVPWQILCQEKGAKLRVIPIDDSGELMLDEYRKLFNEKTKLVAITHVSNALGTVNPIREIVAEAHDQGIPVLVDGAQGAPHFQVDVQKLGCDFYALSGHKMYGPTGIGVLYGQKSWLERMPPYQAGGDMILSVSFEETTYNELPYKFEAGTQNIAGVIGLGAAIDYLEEANLDAIEEHERELISYATDKLSAISGLRIIGTAKDKTGSISFVMDSAHPHDIGTILDQEGIAIRTGHHCAQPVMKRFKIPATARVSFALYNTKEEIDTLVSALQSVNEVFG